MKYYINESERDFIIVDDDGRPILNQDYYLGFNYNIGSEHHISEWNGKLYYTDAYPELNEFNVKRSDKLRVEEISLEDLLEKVDDDIIRERILRLVSIDNILNDL